jgi:hypothetical protein
VGPKVFLGAMVNRKSLYIKFLKRLTNVLECMNSVYYVVAADMFRPLMWPSSGWQEQEYSNVSGRNMSMVTTQ